MITPGVPDATPRALAARLNAGAPPLPRPEAPDLPPPAVAHPPPWRPFAARLADGERVPCLLVVIGGDGFVTPIADILEAVDTPAVHPLPRQPGALRGMIAIRGELVPAYDPAGALATAPATGGAAIVVPRHPGTTGGPRLALLVDDVLDAVPVAAEDVRPLPSGARPDGLLAGVVRRDGRLVGALALDLLLDALPGDPVP